MYTYQIGVLSDCLRLGFKESLQKIAAMGADGLQLYTVSGDFAPENMDESKILWVKQQLAQNRLQISALCGDLGGHGFERADENAEKIPRTKKIIDLAVALGTKVVTTHIGVIPADPGDTTRAEMSKALRELGNYAKARGITLAIETGPEKAVTLRSFLDALGTDGVGVNFDPANLVMVAGDDPVQAVHTLSGKIVHVHAKDGKMLKQTDPKIIYGFFASGGIGDLRLSDYFIETPLGQGDVDFNGVLAALEEIGYRGFLTIEREITDDPVAEIQGAVSFLHGLTRG